MSYRKSVYELIDSERTHQRAKHGDSTPEFLNRFTNLAILTEEVGEVAAELQRSPHDGDRIIAELVQVAAVAVAWLEGELHRSDTDG